MKRIYVLFACILLYNGLLAQGLSVSLSNVQIHGNATDVEEGHSLVHNISGNYHLLTWKRTVASMPAGWVTTVCDDSGCWSPNTSTRTFALVPGDSGLMTLNVSPNGISGNGLIYIDVYDAADSANFNARITFDIMMTAAGINSTPALLQVSLFPNPAKDIVNIAVNDLKIVSIDIYNLVGLKVASAGQSSNGVFTVNVSTLSKGMYFARIVKADGKIITKSFSKN